MDQSIFKQVYIIKSLSHIRIESIVIISYYLNNQTNTKMENVRNRLKDLSYERKQSLFKLYVIVFSILCGLVIYFLYSKTQPQYSQEQLKYLNAYSNFVAQYGKKYSPEQQIFRRYIFYQTYDQIIFHNKQELDSSYAKGINEFTDLTQKQFQELFNIVTSVAKQNSFLEIAQFQYDTYDWSEFLPPVKDQKGYEVSHIFAVITTIQFQINKQRKQGDPWITLSEQQVLDCCDSCGVNSNPKKVYRHIMQYGISTDIDYPYVNAIYNKTKFECKTKNLTKPYKPIKSYEDVNKCSGLNNEVPFHPIVVGVDARQWRSYNAGIFNKCQRTRTHYAVLVGRGIGYWKIRNNWGRKWGQLGYIRIQTGDTCAVCLHATKAIFN